MKGDFLMKNATHRVVILKNCNSDLISQAIFFLKDSNTASEPKILAEAEKIVEKYMKNSATISQQPTKNPAKFHLGYVISGIFFFGIACIFYAFLH